MLGMAPRGQRLSTFLTLQARPVPVLPQGGHPLSKVYLLVALGALGHGGAGPGRVAGRERTSAGLGGSRGSAPFKDPRTPPPWDPPPAPRPLSLGLGPGGLGPKPKARERSAGPPPPWGSTQACPTTACSTAGSSSGDPRELTEGAGLERPEAPCTLPRTLEPWGSGSGAGGSPGTEGSTPLPSPDTSEPRRRPASSTMQIDAK